MGIISSLICYFFVVIVKKRFNYDDSLDAFGIHGIGGTWGAIATGLFANPEINSLGTGLFYGNSKQLFIQLESVAIGYGIAIVGTFVIIFILKRFIKFSSSFESKISSIKTPKILFIEVYIFIWTYFCLYLSL